MTEEEFTRWLNYHSERFPGTTEWIAKNRVAVLHWPKALEKVPYEQAMKVTDAMLAGDIEEPRWPSQLPKAIRQESYQLHLKSRAQHTAPQPVYRHGQWLCSCQMCEDTGRILCWHPDSMRHLQQEGEMPRSKYIVTERACSCSAGDQHVELLRYRYSKDKDGPQLDCFLPNEKQVEDLYEWLQGKAGTRVNAFDEWNTDEPEVALEEALPLEEQGELF